MPIISATIGRAVQLSPPIRFQAFIIRATSSGGARGVSPVVVLLSLSSSHAISFFLRSLTSLYAGCRILKLPLKLDAKNQDDQRTILDKSSNRKEQQ